MERIRGILGSLALIAGATLVGLLVGEGLLRLAGYQDPALIDLAAIVRPVEDEILDYRYRGDVSRTIGGVEYRYNSAGFRDGEHSVSDAAGKARVVVVGDSIADGYGVETEDMFQVGVNRRLGDGFEVINLALSGINTEQEVHLFEQEGLRFQPEWVLLSVSMNDSDPGTSYQNAFNARERQASSIELLGIDVHPDVKRLLQASAMVNVSKLLLQEVMTPAGQRVGDSLSRPWAKPRNQAQVKRGLDRLAALREEHGFQVLLLIWPVLDDFANYRYGEVHRWLADRAEERSFEVLDLQQIFAQSHTASELLVFSNDVLHPNAVGHELAANAIAEWYRERTERAAGH